MARQPEVAGSIQTAMIIAAALIEGFTFFALVICFIGDSRTAELLAFVRALRSGMRFMNRCFVLLLVVAGSPGRARSCCR